MTLCAAGALGFYLLARFDITDEGPDMDFTENAKWFNTKLLIDCRRQKMDSGMSDKAYARGIKEACVARGIVSKHYIHFGRGTGPVKAELQELDGYNIDDLGNWNVNVCRSTYSGHLPIKAMRVVAGHSHAKGVMHIPRDSVIPDEELQYQLFPWVDEKLADIKARANTDPKPTAHAFLTFLKRLRTVILQDVANMMLLGRTHYIFNKPVFQCAMFQRFKSRMKVMLDRNVDPINAAMDVVLPTVCERLYGIRNDASTGFCNLSTTLKMIQDNAFIYYSHIDVYSII